MKSRLLLAILLAAGAVAGGCGHEPPLPGEIAVTSAPDGAAVSIDGQPTGLITPAVLPDLDGGLYTVGVSKDGVTYRPSEREVEVRYGTRSRAHFETMTGSLRVASDPAGAEIILAGAATGRTTPHTFDDLDPGDYAVDVRLPHHRNATGPLTATVVRDEEASADFTLVLATVVLFEGFSNVSCTGCPTMLGYIEALMGRDGFGFDRLLFVKFAGANPNNQDPMFRSNSAMVAQRASYYFANPNPSLPALVIQGAPAAQPGSFPDLPGLEDHVETGGAAPVDFYLQVAAPLAADLDVRDVACEISVVAPHVGVDLSGHQLRAILVYSEVHTAESYNPGGSEYHWVARRDGVAAADIGLVEAGQPAVFTVTLFDPDPADYDLTPFGREVIVFVQRIDTKSVVQAGSTMPGSTMAGPSGPPSPSPSSGTKGIR